ncbi:hypothetical protein M422DRAFT_265693 [Sphaerobolus stellatus SS14]|uniref:Uncharacterized protein n=1 Tax=Sphaerobolus stellatus (strain SS14) TaxID=990650 RepID=A0A0C9V508_SPHS4|nr:hypothetical protein M422DRAFT_265693 [Sphaerobolus stellatus SS14]
MLQNPSLGSARNIAEFGRLDLPFNNTGIAVIGTLIEDLPIEKYQAVLNIDIGSTLTTMAKPISVGAMQADGVVRPEATMDVKYAADAVLHIAGLPNTVQVLEMNIMCVS